MSLQIAAQHLASKGRGPDTMLVHMAPGEVKSLQALARAHGGTLTTNPDTGLPEAGFLSAILPMVAGMALGPAGLGLTAMQAGLAAGALGTVMTGSLQKGLMAGLGAYGGAGIGGVIGNAGTAAIEAGATGAGTALPPVVDAVPTIVAPSAPSSIGITGAEGLSASGMPGVTVGGPINMALPQGTPIAPTGLTPQGIEAYVGSPAPNVTPMPAPVTPQPAAVADTYRNQFDIMSDARAPKEAALREAGPMGRFTRGLSEIAEKPSLLFNKENLGYGAAALTPALFQEPKQATYQGSGPNPYAYSYDPGTQSYSPLPSSSAERRYFDPRYTRLAEGGMARGGISHLGDYSDGGRLLRGPGDGVSDSIPATIANKRPARLADGEFVVPARIVSELGNGSTEAGARKLYAMMNRVQQRRAKTMGKGKVAVNSRADKLLPA